MTEKNYNALRIENQLCFPLYAVSRELIKQYKSSLDEVGLTYTQYITMMIMWERKEVNVKELGQKLFLDSGTLTPLLKKLESKGFVMRARSAKDERNLIVTLTEEGAALKEKALDIPYKMANSTNLTQEESKTLYDLLYKILDGISGNDA